MFIVADLVSLKVCTNRTLSHTTLVVNNKNCFDIDVIKLVKFN